MKEFYPGILDVVLESGLECGILDAGENRFLCRRISTREIGCVSWKRAWRRGLEKLLKKKNETEDVAGRALVRNDEWVS